MCPSISPPSPALCTLGRMHITTQAKSTHLDQLLPYPFKMCS